MQSEAKHGGLPCATCEIVRNTFFRKTPELEAFYGKKEDPGKSCILR